jgi:uncharacterized protein YbaP (TraB family)
LKQVTVILLLVSILLSVEGQDQPGTLLWEVSAPGVKTRSYLFATFHEVDPFFFLTQANAVKKLNEAQILFVEEAYDSAVAFSTSAMLKSWSKNQWEQLLTSQQLDIFNAFTNKAERPDFFFLPPFILTRSIIGMFFMDFCNDGSRTSYQLLDNYIEKLAREQGKRVMSLDEPQAKILTDIASGAGSKENEEYASFIAELMNDMLGNNESGCELLNKYKKLAIDYELETELPLNTARSKSLVERNNKWLTVLKKQMQSQSCFVAVGMRHLFYSQGLISQLRKDGFEIRPLKSVE